MNASPDLSDSDRAARILIVDDEPHNRQVLEIMLAPEGYVLLVSASGEEALALVAQQPPDLILLDIMMPGIDGCQTAAKIKGNPVSKHIPIIMITALNDRATMMLALRAGAEDFLNRPVDRVELCMRVKNLLRLKTYTDAHGRNSQLLESEVNSRTADLVESEHLYRSAFDAAPVGIVHVGPDGEWLRVNQRLCDLLGYSREELQGVAVPALLQSEDAPGEADALDQLARGALNHKVLDEKRYRRRDGTLVWARVNMSVHRDAEDRSPYFILVIEDITKQRTLEAQRRADAERPTRPTLRTAAT